MFCEAYYPHRVYNYTVFCFHNTNTFAYIRLLFLILDSTHRLYCTTALDLISVCVGVGGGSRGVIIILVLTFVEEKHFSALYSGLHEGCYPQL